MPCIAWTMPCASMYNGRTALTSRSKRRILRSLSMRTRRKRSVSWSTRDWFSTTVIQRFRTHWSMTPATTMRASMQFQTQSSELKNDQPWRRSFTDSSNVKNRSMRSSIGPQIRDWMSVSRPMITMLSMMTAETTELKVVDSVQPKSERRRTPTSFNTRTTLNSLTARRAGIQKPDSMVPLARVRGTSHWSATPVHAMSKSKKFHTLSARW
mmetsp:Transcript_22045/g.50372  ORF Transcript_22045/g.50372 Transcript_22045/m.50372 type:complete len:211 (-) Transcript_22045:586-1218(-)